MLKNIVDKEKKSSKISLSPQRNRIMSNDFVYDMSEINEEEIVKGWDEINENGWDPIMGDEEDYPETDDNWLDDFWGEEEFA
jgi:hypothetical protein